GRRTLMFFAADAISEPYQGAPRTPSARGAPWTDTATELSKNPRRRATVGRARASGRWTANRALASRPTPHASRLTPRAAAPAPPRWAADRAAAGRKWLRLYPDAGRRTTADGHSRRPTRRRPAWNETTKQIP